MGTKAEIPVGRFTLDNGLRVVYSTDTSTAMAAVDVLYDTGARDESPALTGMAHLFEHLMFGGSANVADFDAELESAGGSSNAWTGSDFTNFYDVVPAQNVATAFHLESDRMLALDFGGRALEVQRSVVIEEFKQQCLNRPYGDMMHRLRALVYGGRHPYSWPVIGLTPDHIAAVGTEDVRRWFYDHYAPNNAVLAVTGNVAAGDVRRLAEDWFGDIPRRDVAPRSMPAPEFPRADVREVMTGRVPQPMVVIAFPMDAYGTPDYFAADTITDILGAGRSSRFYRRLVAGGDGLFAAADASIIGCEHEGMLLLTASLAPGTDAAGRDAAAEAMLEQARTLAVDGGLSLRELERTFNRFEATFRLSSLSYLNLAQSLATAEIHGEDINETVARQRLTTVADVTRTARKLFFETPSVRLDYIPENT